MNLPAIFIKYLPNLYVILHCFKQANAEYEQYQFNLVMGDLCPDNTYRCQDNKPHFLCPSRNLTPCNQFIIIPVEGHLQTSFIMGHNGIRNKVAEDWGIANMNLVHWSRELATVAKEYLQLCQVNADQCLLVGTYFLKVNQNYAIRYRLAVRWPVRVVRSWYLEISYDVRSFANFLEYRKTHNVANFTQMVWPELEFIGCAAAVIEYRFILIVCYYYPAYVEQNLTDFFKFGTPCSKCMKTRNACSLTFLGLCGLDLDLPNSARMQVSEIRNIHIYSSLFVIYIYYIYIFFCK